MDKQSRIYRTEADEMMHEFDWDTIVHYMDDDIREAIHMKHAEDWTQKQFLAEYLKQHHDTFGSEFVIN